MADNNPEDTSHPFFTRGGFPFVFLPTTFTTGFNFTNDSSHVSTIDNQPTTESPEKKENDEEIEEEEEGAETIDDDADQTDPNDKNDLRISQPKYSQLLKDLDFSHARMVDVTNLLSNELDQQGNYLTPDENENENPRKPLSDDKYQSASSIRSSVSSDEEFDNRNQKVNEKKTLIDAANEIENDLNNFAAIIQDASSLEKKNEQSNHGITKKPTFDEDDDTSKQATQNYDLQDNEQEEIASSSKIPRSNNQQSKSIISSIEPDNQRTKQEEEEQQQPQTTITWESLLYGTDPVQSPVRLISSQPTNESHSTPKKTHEQNQPSSLPEEKSKSRITSSTKPNIIYQSYQITSSSSSSDSDSIVEHVLSRPMQDQPPPPPVVPSQTIRQDSQETLIDENLDDLSSQLKQVLLDQERQTINTSTKEERTTDGLGSMSFPLSTPDILSTDVLENDTSNRPTDELLRRFSNQRQRNSSNIPERPNPQRKKSHHHHQKHSASRHDPTNSRKTDDDWLIMLERLEREHKTRLERQQQQYEDYMQDLEEKMKRRFDDYLTLTNGFQESRLDNYGDPTHPSIPIDSNIGRYKTHSHEHQYRTLAKDLISHHYPADSTLNILTTEKNRSNTIPLRPSKEPTIDLRNERSAQHAKHIADLRLYYEYEINELKSQLNRTRMGHGSSTTRQSIETIERMNNENIRLHDEVDQLRHSLKLTDDENILLKRQVEELREQLSAKDLDLKNYHRTIADLEQQLTEAENERLLRLEDRFREQENENETLRRQLFTAENDTNRMKNRMNDDHKLTSTMTLNVPTSREYGRFTLTTTGKNLSSPISSPRETNINPGRYQSNTSETLLRHAHSPRPMTRITEYLNEKPAFPQPYVSPSRHVYSPRKSSPNRRRVEPLSTRSSVDRQSRQTEQLEQKYDQFLKKKRDLETRLSRIPLRNLTNTDRQLSNVLEREIDRVEQQISSIKVELRKVNTLRSH